MRSLLPKTSQRRKNRIVVLSAVLFRERGAANWRFSVRYDGKRAMIYDTEKTLDAAAMEFAVLKVRDLTRQGPKTIDDISTAAQTSIAQAELDSSPVRCCLCGQGPATERVLGIDGDLCGDCWAQEVKMG